MNAGNPFGILKLQMRVVKHPDRVEATVEPPSPEALFLAADSSATISGIAHFPKLMDE